jgi:hypothetical protein
MPRTIVDVTDTPVPVKAKKNVAKKIVAKKTTPKKVTAKTPAQRAVKKAVSVSVKMEKKPLSVEQLYGFLEAIAEGEEFSVEQRMKATLTLLNKKGEHMSDNTSDTKPKTHEAFSFTQEQLEELRSKVLYKIAQLDGSVQKKKSVKESDSE